MDPAQTPDDPEDPDQQPRPAAPPRQPPHPAALQPGAPPASSVLPPVTGAAGPRLAMAPPLHPIVADQRLFTSAFVRVLGMQAAYGFSFSLFFLLPKYLATLGESPARIGFVMGGFGVACILTIPFLAPLVTRLGRRGALMAATTLLAAAGLAFALLPNPGLMAIPLRAAEGVTWTIMFSTAVALTADIAPPDRLAQAIGLAGAASLIMNAVAPAIGEPLADAFGFRWVFFLAALAALAAALLARRLLIPTTTSPGRSHSGPVRATTEGHGPASVSAGDELLVGRMAIYVVFALSGLAFSVLFTFLGPFALSQGMKAIRSFFVAYTTAALAVRVVGGRLADRLGHRLIAATALFLYGCVVASTGLLAPHHLVVLGLGFGLAHGALYPALMALLINLAPSARRPRILGLANGAMSIGISSVFPAGLLVARAGYPATFAVAGGLVALASLLLRKRPR